MTFIMNPLLYPNIIKQGRQLDFHQFVDSVAPVTFGYPPVISRKFPDLHRQIQRSFLLLQGENLVPLTESMMGNLMLLFRQDHLGEGQGGWRTEDLFQFCSSVMFEATFMTLYGRPASGRRHGGMSVLREEFVQFDRMFPLLMAQIPIWLLGRTNAIRRKLISYFLRDRMSRWSDGSLFVKRRSDLLERYAALTDGDRAAHHFAILWASVGNTVPATFWALYHLLSHPEALRAVRQEVQSVLTLPTEQTVTIEQLDRLLYLESAIRESLRLSSASMNIRVAQEDFALRLDGRPSVSIRKGDIIALYPQSIHMDPDIYQEPQTFRFDRFVQDSRVRTDFYKDGQKLRYYLMPFGSGSSMCPGRHFAINEIKQFLCLLLLHFDLQLVQGQTQVGLDFSRAGLGILLPANDVLFRYRLLSA
ncbi:cytochrome P450 7B1 isoform X2 [Genypterus blacodes]